MKHDAKSPKTPEVGDRPRGIDGVEDFMIRRGLPLDRDTYLALYFAPDPVPDPIPGELLADIPDKYQLPDRS